MRLTINAQAFETSIDCDYLYIPDHSLLGDGLSLSLKPIPRPFVIYEEVVGLLPDFRVVLVHPLDLSIAQKRWLNEVTVNGSHGSVLKAQPRLITKIVRCLHFTGHNDI